MSTISITAPSLSKYQLLLLAIRPKTLPASIAPVLLTAYLARSDPKFSWTVFGAILACALLIQIAVNLANDLGDFLKGADNTQRVGPPRVTQAGLVSVRSMKQVIVLTLLCALVIGSYLVSVGGMPILIIGFAAILSSLAYTAGPLPLAYVGLGDLFVMLFFGPIATTGTYYLLTSTYSTLTAICGVGFGAISTAILVVNNLRDVEGDQVAGKNTLVVRFGRRFARCEYLLCILIATIAVPVSLYAAGFAGPKIFFGLLPLVFAYPTIRSVSTSNEAITLNLALAATGKLLLIYALFLAIGLS